MTGKIKISQDLLNEIFEHAFEGYPHEVCGFVLGVEGEERVAQKIFRARNIQDALHAREPERYSRTAATAYVIDPQDEKKVQELVKETGWPIISIYHSHPDHGAYFSEEDKTNAAPWGEPFFPQISYLVVSVYDRQVKAVADFRWDSEQKDFIEDLL